MKQVLRLKREHKMRKDGGLDIALINARAAAKKWRSPRRPHCAPVKAPRSIPIARPSVLRRQPSNAARRSSRTRRQENDLHAEVRGRFHGRRQRPRHRIIVATGFPTPLFGSLRRHFWFKSSYRALTEVLPAKIRQGLGKRAVVLRDAATPPHGDPLGDDDDCGGGGADGDVASAGRCTEKTYRCSAPGNSCTSFHDLPGDLRHHAAYGWESPYALTAEGLPYLGPHRNFPFHLFAFGDSSQGVTGAYSRQRVLLRHHLDELDASDAAFDFNR
jgi:hypothetical protein